MDTSDGRPDLKGAPHNSHKPVCCSQAVQPGLQDSLVALCNSFTCNSEPENIKNLNMNFQKNTPLQTFKKYSFTQKICMLVGEARGWASCRRLMSLDVSGCDSSSPSLAVFSISYSVSADLSCRVFISNQSW